MITDLIHVMGESHVCSFTGQNKYRLTQIKDTTFNKNDYDMLPQFRTYVFDNLRAYHFTPTSTYSVTKLFFSFLNTNIPPPATLLLSIGEVDCRGPILNKLNETSNSLEELVNECVHNYLIGVDYLVSLGYNVILYGPILNCRVVIPGDQGYHSKPTHLTMEKWCDLKEQSVLLFTKRIRRSKFPVVSLVEWMLLNNICYQPIYWQDILHVSIEAWPKIKSEFSQIGIEVL